MIGEKVQAAFNDQLNLELFSAYLYSAMAAQFDYENLHGISHWFEAQVQEELGHAAKFYKYINETGGRVMLKQIDQPAAEFGSPTAAFQTAREHEAKVTESIHNLVRLAREESDYASEIFLQWFVTEQVEEEAVLDDILKKFNMVGSDPRGLFMIDRQLAMRGK
jgi:ferritin